MLVAVGLAPLPSHAGHSAHVRIALTAVDANTCSLAAPCRTFAAALGQTNAGGEIVVLDSAGYGPMTINKAVSIVVPPGIYAGVSVLRRRPMGFVVSAGRHRRGRPARTDDQQPGRQQRHRVQQRRGPLRRELHDSRLRGAGHGESSSSRRAARRSSSSRTATSAAGRPGSASPTAPRRPRQPSTTRGSKAT